MRRSEDRSWIIGYLDGYCVQYWGEVHSKPRERVVIANFFLCSMHDLVGDYSAEIVAVMAGGAASSHSFGAPAMVIAVSSPGASTGIAS